MNDTYHLLTVNTLDGDVRNFLKNVNFLCNNIWSENFSSFSYSIIRLFSKIANNLSRLSRALELTSLSFEKYIRSKRKKESMLMSCYC